MKLSLSQGVLVAVAETPEDAGLCDALARLDGHVLRLSGRSARGFSLHDLGEEALARREPLNITRSVAAPFEAISNLAHTPFELEGVAYASVEGFWQSLKSDDPARRREIAAMSGPEAKKAGEGPADYVSHGGEVLIAGSPEHWALMERAIEAKFTQNGKARKALLATGERLLTHRVRHDSRTIPGAIMADIWMRVRERLTA